MKKTRVGKWIAAAGTGLALLLGIIIPMGGGALTDPISNDEAENHVTVAEAATVSYPSATSLGQFPVGYSYNFTDKSKAKDFHNGSETTDITKVKVESGTHGTQTNPYVISTTNDWDKFVQYVTNDTSGKEEEKYGGGEYFVLANDIDFSSVATFYAVPYFNGTFYGLGHTLSKITSKTWTFYSGTALSSSTKSYGLFCQATNATITDLILKDFSYQNPPNVMTSSSTTTGNRGSSTGGIVGWLRQNGSILNCHVNGSFTSTVTYTYHVPLGGIVGWDSSENMSTVYNTLIYRCSADVTSDFKTNSASTRVIILGGIIGENYYCKKNLTIYDCAANVTQTTTSGQYGYYKGSLIGISGAGNAYDIDGFIGKLEVNSETDLKSYSGSLIGYHMDSSTTGTYKGSTISAKNCYTEAIIKNPEGNRYFYAIAGGGTSGVASDASLNNVNYSTNGFTAYCSFASGQANFSTKPKPYTSSATMLSDAQGIVGATGTATLNANIWNAAKIGGSYTPDNSPVRNYLAETPKDIEVTYTGKPQTITGADWYADSVHGDTDVVTYSISTPMVNANESGYSVTLNLKSGYRWTDGTSTSKTIKVKVMRKEIALDWSTASGAATATVKSGLVNDDLNNPPAISYTYYKDGVELSGTPQTIGGYTAVASIPSTSNYIIKTGEETHDFTLSAVPIVTPTVSGNLSQTYTGKDIVFYLANDEPINEGKIVELTQADMPTGATYNKFVEDGITKRTITVKQCGNYPIQFTLTDQSNTCWSNGTGILRLAVEKQPLTLTVERENGWELETNTTESFTVTAVTGLAADVVDNIRLAITYEKPDETVVTVGNDKIKVDATGKVFTVTLDPLDAGDHKITVGLADASASNANGNYLLSAPVEKSITVVGKKIVLEDSDIVWQYSDGKTSKTLLDGDEIPYCGKNLTASIKTDKLIEKGLSIVSYTNESGMNVGEYTTTVLITKINDSYDFTDKEFSISWKIVKAKIDLSDVEWDYKDAIGYTGGTIVVQLLRVPQMLTASYEENRKIAVSGGGYYTASVSFKFKNSADSSNYYAPTQGNTNSYDYDGEGDFPWTLQWQIKKGVIDLSWDLDGQEVTGADNYVFTYPTLLSGGNNVEYKFYRNVEGDVAGSDEISVSSIQKPADNTTEYYWVEAVLTDDAKQNFDFGSGVNPRRFVVGDYRTAVTVTVTKNGGMYSGEEQPLTFTSQALPVSEFEVTYYDKDGIVLDGAPVDAGTYTARITVSDKNGNDQKYYVTNRSHTIVITKFTLDPSKVEWNYTEPFIFTRTADGEVMHRVELKNMPTTLNLIYTGNEFSAAGSYTATVALGEDIDYANIDIDWSTVPESVKTLSWEIVKRELSRPSSVSSLTYNGGTFDLIELIGLDSDWAQYLTVSVRKGAGATPTSDYEVTDAGTYYITCTPISSLRNSVKWAGENSAIDKSVTVKIDPLYVTVIGWEDKPAVAKFKDDVGFSQTKIAYKVDGEEISADSVATTYNKDIVATVEVLDEYEGNIYIDYGEGVEMSSKFRMFQGQPTYLERPTFVNAQLQYNFKEQTFVINNWRNLREYVTILGSTGTNDPLTVSGDFIGKRTVRIALRSDLNVAWTGSADKRLEIVELTLEVVAGRLPNKITDWVLNGEGLYELFSADYNVSEIVEYEYFDSNGSPVNPKNLPEGTEYSVVAYVRDEYKEYFCFGTSESEDGVTLIGSSDERTFKIGGGQGSGSGTTTVEKPDPNTNKLPLWQLIVSGVCILLFLVCAAKSYGNISKAKAAKREAKELASQSYAANYAFAPLPLLAIGLWGLGETPWTIIACVAIGLFVISLAVMMITSKKRKAAELALKREQARVAEEKEYAREEEMRRRDNEMKMMFAAMQQGGYGQQMNYGDMQNMIASTISALLPAMQQQMALPPAQSDPNAYAQPQQPAYNQPQQGFAQQTGYGGASEADALRAQMAEQQARMEAQMAEQRELINKLLQNQAQPSASAYEEDEFVDDTSWLGENDEVVSLEESYGALSDDAKRFYYEIGSYIMSKSRISQNDGKYAVLFKYRGRTLFKLCIKDDAPVLYYPTGDGGRGEVSISAPASLELAKGVIDRNVMKVDNELA